MAFAATASKRGAFADMNKAAIDIAKELARLSALTDLLEARYAARAGVARGHPHGPRPCRWDRVARSALPLPFRGRAKDHGRPLVGPAVLRPQAAAAGLYLKRESGPWRGLITREPG